MLIGRMLVEFHGFASKIQQVYSFRQKYDDKIESLQEELNRKQKMLDEMQIVSQVNEVLIACHSYLLEIFLVLVVLVVDIPISWSNLLVSLPIRSHLAFGRGHYALHFFTPFLVKIF